ncbi:MAG: ABC transporter ATP-binding protein, partial [Puniceicoccales bacterium]|nr:ABC transporter ATP-binding protein [Puniceicoccales bacterium]
MSDFILELRNVQKKFQHIIIFDGINLAVNRRETVSICGNSGSGKTTLGNVAGLIEPPNIGSVIWNGEDMTDEKMSRISKLRPKIFGYIFQQCNLIPELNVMENILLPKRIMSQIARQDIDFAKTLLKQVNLDGFDLRHISTLSGGERQRIAAIRAMINHPPVVVADEPTGSLDEKSADSTMDMIIGLCKLHGSAL